MTSYDHLVRFPGFSSLKISPNNIYQFEVKLKKTESGSLGLSIVGGRCSRLGDIGVFIKSTIENTPAASNGLLTPCKFKCEFSCHGNYELG